MENNNFKSGFITIIGRPNVGKSTLMNHFIGQKIAIMSDKAQTTRNRIQGVITDTKSQIIFVDTPGIHKPKHALGEFMVNTAYQSLRGVDGVLFVVNASEKIGPGDRWVIQQLKNISVPVFLVINKIDLIKSDDILPIIDSYQSLYDFDEIYPISALEGNNTARLLVGIRNILPEGPQYYPKDQIMDHPEYFVVEEFIREKVLHFTSEEIPHSVAVQVESMKRDLEENTVFIQAVIIVERESQKGIVIGNQGKKIKSIRRKAKQDIQDLLGSKVDLEIWVKVQKGWRDRLHQLKDLGYRPDNY